MIVKEKKSKRIIIRKLRKESKVVSLSNIKIKMKMKRIVANNKMMRKVCLEMKKVKKCQRMILKNKGK